MIGILSVILPVFALMGLGWLAGRFGWLDASAGEGLSAFVFQFCIPSLIFRTMVTAVLPGVQPWGYWLAYFIALGIVWFIAMQLARRVFAAPFGESVVAGFAAAQANTVLVGIPLILQAFGDEGAAPLFLLIAIHTPVTITTATLLIEGSGGFDVRVFCRKLIVNPILLSLACGIAWRNAGLPFGGPLRSVVESLGAAAIPCSLFAMGLALRRYGLKAQPAFVATLAALKLIVHPGLVWLLAYRVFSMPPAWAGVAVLFAAMPCGVNSYLFAERYRVGTDISSSAIAVSTAFSPFTSILWLALVHPLMV